MSNPTRELAPYLSPERREARLEELAANSQAELVIYGNSVEGRPLRAARLAGPDTDCPRLLCTANIHGPEYISSTLALALLQELGRPDSLWARLRQRAELWVIPCLNPDAYDRTWARSGRGRLATLRPNARGVDLNRNFPLPCGGQGSRLPWAGARRKGSPTYRGPAALSEPECSSLDSLLRRVGFLASANLHSAMGSVIPARVKDRETFGVYKDLCRRFREAQPRNRYFRLASRLLDVNTGELEDHQHHTLDCWAVCVETMTIATCFLQQLSAPTLFWRFNPRDPGRWIGNDLPGLAAYYEAALDLGHGPRDLPRC
ncbi:M14 family metallopeptidase [Planctomycetota bacterium]